MHRLTLRYIFIIIITVGCIKPGGEKSELPPRSQTPPNTQKPETLPDPEPTFDLLSFNIPKRNIPIAESRVTLHEDEAELPIIGYQNDPLHDPDHFIQSVKNLKKALTEKEIKEALLGVLLSTGTKKGAHALTVALAHALRLATGQAYFRKPWNQQCEIIFSGCYGPSIVPSIHTGYLLRGDDNKAKQLEFEGFTKLAEEFQLDPSFQDDHYLNEKEYFSQPLAFDEIVEYLQNSDHGSLFFIYLPRSECGSLALNFRGQVFLADICTHSGQSTLILNLNEFLTRYYSSHYTSKNHSILFEWPILYARTRLTMHPWILDL